MTDTTGGKKTKKVKIPKRVAGVKIPKDLRRAGEAAIERAQTPQGREMIAAGLSMAAAAATAAVVRARAEREARDPASAAAPKPTAEAMGQMAEMLIARLVKKG